MSEQRTMAYQPALDGVRAVAVVLVLVFHGGASWLTGGYVGVSVFFTLSGYLITSLLVIEHERSGTVRLGAFYARRMKRLLPASLLCLGAVAIAAAFGAFGTFPELRRDLLAALFQVANWGKLVGDTSYADLTNATLGRVAPLEHYWSLAIEEQFYWLWPLVVLGLFRWLRSTRRVSAAVVVLAVFAGIAAPVIAGVWGPDAAYWATPARVGEILVGAVLAVVQHRRGPLGRWSVVLAPLGLAVVLWAALTWPAGSGPAYEGWFPVFAVASAALIAGLQQPSPVRSALSWRPVVWVGTVSYGLYLYHWPIYAVVTEDRVGTGGVGLFAVRIAITVALAWLSARFVERPVRAWNPTWPRPLVSGGIATLALSALVVVAVHPAGATDLRDADADAAAVTLASVDGTLAPLSTVAPTTIDAAATTSPPSSPAASAPSTAGPDTSSTTSSTVPTSVPVPAVSRPVRIMVVGDSTAQYTAAGLAAWAADHPDVAQVTDASVAGCGFLRTGRVPTDGEIDWQGQCDDLLDGRLPGLLTDLQPDVVMLMVTMRDVEDREWDDEGVISPFDERFRARLLADYTAMAERLRAAGVPRIAWVLPPYPIAPFQGEQVKMLDPARYQVQFDVIGEVAAAEGDLVRVLDLRAWLQAVGQDRSGEWRPDGLHWREDKAYEVADRYLVGSLVSAALG
jgi:peptidoglycan/LPS O-acetylase OafA/YrhL